MTYLSGEQMSRLAKDGRLAVKRGESQVTRFDTWDVPLHMGAEAFISTEDTKRTLGPNDTVCIQPGEFALLLTEEVLQLPDDHVGFISVKFDLKQRGLSNISGFHVDPGYRGHLLFSVYNAGANAVIIERGQTTFMMGLSRLEGSEPRSKAGIARIESDHMMAVKGRRISVNHLDQRLARLEEKFTDREDQRRTFRNRVLGGVGSVLLLIIGWALGKFL